MSKCTCGASGGIDGHAYTCALRQPQEGSNRVLVGLPARLNDAKVALKDHEKLVESLRKAYAQRGMFRDSVILDEMGELLGCPKIAGNSSPPESIPGNGCPACGPGHQTGPFCSAHSWHNPR